MAEAVTNSVGKDPVVSEVVRIRDLPTQRVELDEGDQSKLEELWDWLRANGMDKTHIIPVPSKSYPSHLRYPTLVIRPSMSEGGINIIIHKRHVSGRILAEGKEEELADWATEVGSPEEAHIQTVAQEINPSWIDINWGNSERTDINSTQPDTPYYTDLILTSTGSWQALGRTLNEEDDPHKLIQEALVWKETGNHQSFSKPPSVT